MPTEPVITLLHHHHPVIRQRCHSVWGVSKLRHPTVSVWSNAWLIVSVIQHESAATSQTFPLLSTWRCLTHSVAVQTAQQLVWFDFPCRHWAGRSRHVKDRWATRFEYQSTGDRINCSTHLYTSVPTAESHSWCWLQEEFSLISRCFSGYRAHMLSITYCHLWNSCS